MDRDRPLVIALNTASRELAAAVEQLTAGLSPEAIRAVWGQAALDAGLSGRRPPVLAGGEPVAALERVADRIHSAFIAYEHCADERRQLAFDVGEAQAGMVAALLDAGVPREQARRADIDALAAGRLEIHDTTGEASA
ncbi:hypothetical protein Q5424_08370 [Conexibacter sp. JD483]|uniref:hypothetical protein n=1 Tax=unclassified Conexibacter TaxID=2627773 RepID=UPI0027211991|nr:MULTISPECIES: hypothetical protein [unclassified Conexibacter]MDO8183947.1 hypothetical protein [Conexibacter sp. CPCC 205706]MDO8196939.1 hypothetical protein [Conexibacter sp. CPCC 205762]MDR9369091.1 hypothetical protein [Conexibacter sp. JD483]